jgi:hypothetical protein
LVLGFITAVIHAVVLNLQGLDWLMLLNGLGFLDLIGIIFFDPSFLAGQRKLIMYLLIAYTLVTILGYFVLNSSYGSFGIIAKIDEVLLSKCALEIKIRKDVRKRLYTSLTVNNYRLFFAFNPSSTSVNALLKSIFEKPSESAFTLA